MTTPTPNIREWQSKLMDIPYMTYEERKQFLSQALSSLRQVISLKKK